MRFNVLYLPHVPKELEKLDPQVKKLVKKAIERIADNPTLGKKLTDSLSGHYSYRTSHYRIVYEVHHKEIHTLIVGVGHRREIYDKLKNLLT